MNWLWNILVTWVWSAEPWVYRYQTLLVGLVALYVAFNQMQIAKRQHKMAEDLQKTDKAIAALAVDRVLDIAAQAVRSLATARTVVGGNQGWDHRHLPRIFGSLSQIDDISFQQSAVTAFPDQATELTQMAVSLNVLRGLAEDFAERPWPSDPFSIALGEVTPRDTQKREAANEAIGVLSRSFSGCAALHPNARLGKPIFR